MLLFTTQNRITIPIDLRLLLYDQMSRSGYYNEVCHSSTNKYYERKFRSASISRTNQLARSVSGTDYE